MAQQQQQLGMPMAQQQQLVQPATTLSGSRRGPPLAYVKGVDGLPAESKTCPKGKRPELSDVWSTNGKVSVDQDGVDTIAIDFTEKTGGKVGLLVGKHEPAC